MKRPIGLILSAILLGLGAFFLLLATALMALVSLSASHEPSSPAMPHFAIFLFLGLSVFYAILTVWAILTVIGILRLRPWARYSILIIGGCAAALSTLMVLGTTLSRTMLFTVTIQQPASDPRIMAIVFITLTVIYILTAAVGIWWLVYFNRRATRSLFLDQSLTPGFNSSDSPHRPIAIIVLAGFFFLSTMSCVLFTVLPFPAFLFGFMLPAKVSHVLYLTLALLTGFTGYGLLRLKESGRIATIAFLVFGCCNVALSFLPWYQTQFRLYMTRFMTAFPTYPNQWPVLFSYTKALMLASGIFALVIYAIVFWLLHRHRAAFSATPGEPSRET